jgi:hypothetical protein
MNETTISHCSVCGRVLHRRDLTTCSSECQQQLTAHNAAAASREAVRVRRLHSADVALCVDLLTRGHHAVDVEAIAGALNLPVAYTADLVAELGIAGVAS